MDLHSFFMQRMGNFYSMILNLSLSNASECIGK